MIYDSHEAPRTHDTLGTQLSEGGGLEPGNPLTDPCVDQRGGFVPRSSGTAIGIGDLELALVAKQKGLAPHGRIDVAEGLPVVRLHHQHQFSPPTQGHAGLLRTMG